MLLRIAAVIALALYVTSLFSPFAGPREGSSSTGWQLTHYQVDGTFQLIRHLIRDVSMVSQISRDQQTARYLVFMFGISSATAGIIAAIAAGLCNRAWLCLIFAVAALASATIVVLQLLELTRDQPFEFEFGAWLWLGSMCWLAPAAGWTLWRKRQTLPSQTMTAVP